MTATIRTFRAADAREALVAIKASLGPHAIILSTREVKGGLFRKNEIEVTAALPHPTLNGPAAAAKYQPRPTPPDLSAAVTQQLPPLTPPHPKPLASAPRRIETKDEELAQLAAAAPAPAAASAGAEAALPPGLQPALSLKYEMAELKAQLTALQNVVHPHGTKLPDAAHRLREHLVDARGMEPQLADDVVRLALQRADQPYGAVLMNSLREVLAERVVAGRAPWLPDRRRIIGLVGPTGVGKTTTLAKIAAHALQQQQSVALITLDTFRIGATEQLGHYGAIMKVPSFVARSQAELAQAVRQCGRADLVLIDTAGCSKKEQLAEQTALVRSIAASQLYLVASAAAGAHDLRAVVERYRPYAPERLILTKLDEAAAPAAFLSASFRLNRPLVAITDGQRVPEDIHAPSTPELIEQLIGPFAC